VPVGGEHALAAATPDDHGQLRLAAPQFHITGLAVSKQLEEAREAKAFPRTVPSWLRRGVGHGEAT
jgi:hypothetical protein